MKDKAPRPEVEELSDLQWARLERGLWQRMDASPAEAGRVEEPGRGGGARWRLRGLAIGGALAMVAVLLLVVLLPGLEDGGGGRGSGSEAPARVVTRESATTVSFAEAAIEVAPRSALLMSGSAERGATIVLERGRAGFHVAPRQADRAFVVVAGNAMVRVVGTRFEVARQGEAVEVAVREGKVDVRYLGQVYRVAAGDRWSSPAAEETAGLLEVGAKAGADAGQDAADDAAAASEAEARAAAESRKAAERAVAERAQRAQRSSSKGTSPSAPPSEEGAVAAPPAASSEPETSAAETAALAAEFAAAARLESSAPQEALRRYQALARRDDRWGSNALYAAARLALDVGERERAATLARSYLRRFPRGLNAPDARALLEAMP